MKEIHGIARVSNICSDRVGEQTITVIDGGEFVILQKSKSSDAGLTPDQADMLASQLAASAARVRTAIDLDPSDGDRDD